MVTTLGCSRSKARWHVGDKRTAFFAVWAVALVRAVLALNFRIQLIVRFALRQVVEALRVGDTENSGGDRLPAVHARKEGHLLHTQEIDDGLVA